MDGKEKTGMMGASMGSSPKAPTGSRKPKSWVLYVLRCGDGSLYCGITNDLKKRLAAHRSGKGARYTRGRGPLVLRRSWPMKNKSQALKAEIAFKKLARPEKQLALRGKPVFPVRGL